MRLVARGVELVRDPIHPEVDVVGGVAAELLAVVDGPAAREEAAPRGGAVPVGVCAARKGAGQRSAGQREASGAAGPGERGGRGVRGGRRTVVGEDDAFFGERRDVLRPGGRGRVVDPRVVIAQVVLRQRQQLSEAGPGAGGGGSTCRMEMMWGFDPASGGPPAAAAASATAASMTVLGSKKGPGARCDHACMMRACMME